MVLQVPTSCLANIASVTSTMSDQDSSMKPIEEAELNGKWLFENGKVVGDETEERIWDLVRNRFTRLADRDYGWVILYRDPVDRSLWELSLPQSGLQGGGPAL